LWASLAVAGRVDPVQLLAALASGVVLWGLYFALGFRAFARGMQANSLGLVLTVGLPLITCVLFRSDLGFLAALVPPGSVYYPITSTADARWLPGPLVAGAFTLLLGRWTRHRCVDDLRRWYDLHHGQKGME
jgi:hypothetical protein